MSSRRSRVLKKPTEVRAWLEGLPGPEKERLLDLRERALSGDYWAYRAINGFLPETTASNPVRMRRFGVTERIVETHLADLRCRVCGAWHGKVPRRIVEDSDGEGRLEPVGCPSCGEKDCAGPRFHAEVGAKGYGKTKELELMTAFRVGLYTRDGYLPKVLVIGANLDEAKARIQCLAAHLVRPTHRFVFGERATPLRIGGRLRGSSFSLWVAGTGGTFVTLARGYGVLSAPSGHHADIVFWDDGCNKNNSYIRRQEAPKVRLKFYSTVMQGTQPWTSVDYLGNPCTVGDLNFEVMEKARLSPDKWTSLEIFSGGPEDGFRSHCPELWPSDALRGFYEQNPEEYRCVFMGQPLAAGGVAVRSVSYWVHADDIRHKPRAREVLEAAGVPVLSEGDFAGMVTFVGADPAFTPSGPKAATVSRSRSGWSVESMDLATRWMYIRAADEDYLGGEQLRGRLLDLARRHGTMDLAIEASQVHAEMVSLLRRAGLNVRTYNPAGKDFGGSKVGRKAPVCDALNEGRLFLRGLPIGNGPECEVAPEMRRLGDAIRAFPAKESDVFDAVEVGARMMWFIYGCVSTGITAQPARRSDAVPMFVAAQGGEDAEDLMPVADEELLLTASMGSMF